MEKRLVTEAERLLNSRHQNKRRTQVIRGLALLVVLATISALMLPAITMSNEVECGMEEHIHSENCYAVQQVAPQPMLICTEGQFGEMLLHVHDSFCYDSQGNLICTLQEMEAHTHGPECYQERRALICTETSDPGHQHEASCYSYVKVENAAISMDMMAPTATNEYVCGMQEGEGAHQHTDNCYPKERTQRLICAEQESDEDVTDEEGNVLIPAHRHNSGCYEVQETPVFERFICTQEESDDEYDSDGSLIRQGHRHDGGCWLRGDELCYQEGCHQHESSGHQHTGACVQAAPQESIRVDGQGEQWEQTLVCQEPEREPGHIHTDACYEITQMLACQKAELEAHTHGASCEDENGALICGKTEISAHQHTDACFTVPEGGSEEAEVLICGMDEHTHTDLCYVKTQPETEKFYCGMEEHVHTTECEFPSGALKCTIPEHYHIDTCLAPPVEESEEPGESPGPEESQLPEDIVEVKDAEFVYHENPAFVVTFKVNGFARVAGDQPEQLPQDGGPVFSGEELTEIIDQAAPLAAMPRMMSMMALVDDMPSSGPDLESTFTPAATTDETDSTTAPGSVSEPEGTAVENSSHPILPAFSEPVPEISFAPVFSAVPEESVEPIFSMPVESAEPSQDVPEAPVEFYVEELGEHDPRYQAVMNAEAGGEDAILQQVIALNAAWNGRKLDLSECTITAVIKPTQALIEAVQSEAGIMSAVEDGAAPDGGEDPMEQAAPALNVYTVNGRESTVLLDGKAAEQAEAEIMLLSEDGTMGVTVNKEVYPNFTVEYYAKLATVYTSGEPINTKQPTLINTSGAGNGTGGKLPGIAGINSAAPPLLNMLVDDNGTVVTDADKGYTKEIFKPHLFNYASAPRMNHIDIVTRKEGGGGHYTLDEIWVIGENGEPTGKKYTWDPDDPYELTNNPKTASATDKKYILIQNGAKIRLVYTTTGTESGKTVDANFFDYDITDGYTYKTNSATEDNKIDRTDSGDKYLNTNMQGINSYENYTGSGTKFGFGNSDMNTPIGFVEWQGQLINKANGSSSESRGYGGCSFKLVKNQMANGKLQFSDGIDGPDLFGKAKGSTSYEGDLTFKRQGDTYTLTTAAVKDTEMGPKTLVGLDKLTAGPEPSYSFKFTLFSNRFWPLDNVSSAGTVGHDPKFGSVANQYKTFSTSAAGGTSKADDETDHNCYFGMNFKVEFTLYDDYVGPLEYYFFGDDDMWVYLTNKKTGEQHLICDIGGVHPSVGEYVNLWDWIVKDSSEFVDVTTGDPEVITQGKTEYELTFFYTERGASGSTCWMQFTLPEMRGGSLRTPQSDQYGTLEVEKTVTGPTTEGEFEFRVKLTDEAGNSPADLLGGVFKSDQTSGELGKVDTVEFDDEGCYRFNLKNGQSLLIRDIPLGTSYEVEELNNEGYSTSFLIHDTNVLGGNPPSTSESGVAGTKVTGTVEGGHAVRLVCLNASYELPETGGSGIWYTMACVPLAALFCLMYKKKSQGEGDGG